MIALSGHTRVAFVGVGRVGALPPWPWRVRRSARLGGIGKPVPSESPSSEPCEGRARALRCIEPVLCEPPSPALCDVPSPTEPVILRSSTSSILPEALYPPSSLYSATLLGMPLSQALIYSLTVYPPSASPIILLPLYLTSPTILTLAPYPSPSTFPTILWSC